MKKIAVICTLYGPNGGTGRVTTEIIERYAADGNEVHVFCGQYDESFMKTSKITSIKKLNITKIGVLQQLDMLIKATRMVKRRSYDIVYTTGDYHLHPDIVTIHILKKYGRKEIERLEKKGVLKHGNMKPKDILRKIYCPLLFESGEQIVFRQTHAIYIGVSDGVIKEFQKKFDRKQTHKLYVIPNGVDEKKNAFDGEARYKIREELGMVESQKVMLFVGSDWKRKRLDVAIELCAKHQELRLIVAGHDEATPYQKLAAEYGCENRIFFVGFKKNIEKYYSACDYFIFTSAYETFGLVAIEAMAAGAIVISNKLNGVEDFIESGVNGFLTEDASTDSFDEKLNYILTHPELEEGIKRNAVKTAQNYSWEKCYSQYKRIFDDYKR